ncbi:hypothetical protein GGR28_003174 [Lewinella aquimaris]|uniref:Uncharacterized protein n=1 Tax=Neolewinella aquimaris TaxID=1835722 RepID=A0A840E656_9BACT|nr:hypothetical protein [Neolewinella aquimaris]MBB4080540.1 hypothetical protein [Neolewinella aquimaris]
MKFVYTMDEKFMEFENFELERIFYLEKVNPNLAIAHISARNSLINILRNYGLLINRSMKGEGASKNIFSLMSNDDEARLTEKPLNGVDLNYEVSTFNKLDYRLPTIDCAIIKFKKYLLPEQGYLITTIDTIDLIRSLDAVQANANSKNDEVTFSMPEDSSESRWIEGPGAGQEKATGTGGPSGSGLLGNIKFLRIKVFKDSLFMFFTEAGPLGNGQGGLPTSNVKIPYTICVKVNTDTILFPPRLKFTELDTNLVNDLINNPKKLDFLQSTYGNYEIMKINEIMSEAIKKSHDSVSVLGFDISRKWFPVAMFLILLSVYYLLYDSLKLSNKLQFNVVSDYASEDVFQVVLRSHAMRFCLWVMAPLLFFVFTVCSTPVYFSPIYYLFVYFCSVCCLTLGIISFSFSLKK